MKGGKALAGIYYREPTNKYGDILILILTYNKYGEPESVVSGCAPKLSTFSRHIIYHWKAGVMALREGLPMHIVEGV